MLRCDGGISDYWYRTDISKDTCNTVKLYQAGRKETEHLAFQAENAEKVGIMGEIAVLRSCAFYLDRMHS